MKNPDNHRSGDRNNDGNDENLHQLNDDRERILGAALAILAAYPDKCRNDKGQVDINKIIDILEDKGKFWFSGGKPSLSGKARYELINRWLSTVC